MNVQNYIPPGAPLPCGVINWAAGPPTPLTGPASPTNTISLVNSSITYAHYRPLIINGLGTSKQKSIKFESDLLKTKEDIALQSHRILQTRTALYKVGRKFVRATAIQTTVKFSDFVEQNLRSI